MTYIYVMGLICAYGKTLNNYCVRSEKIISIGYILAENQANEKILHMTYIYVTVSWEQHVMTYIYVIRRERVKRGPLKRPLHQQYL